jgi:hypothetical protein
MHRKIGPASGAIANEDRKEKDCSVWELTCPSLHGWNKSHEENGLNHRGSQEGKPSNLRAFRHGKSRALPKFI